MEFLRKLFLQTQQNLKGLTASQKIAIGSCAALIVVALVSMMTWAGTPVMVPLLDQTIAAEELTAIQNKLGSLGVKYTVSGDRVLVPAADQYRLRAQLAEAQLLPRDTSIGFIKMIEKSTPWTNMVEQDRRWALALSTELSAVLREFRGVADARVFLDKTMKRQIGQASIVPTASVFIRPKTGVKLESSQFTAMAVMVSAAVGGLDPMSVKVADMVTGRSYTVANPEDMQATDDLSDRRAKEEYYADKIRKLLAPRIPGILVEVSAKLDAESTQTVAEKHGKPAITLDKSETETSKSGKAAEEPGVNPNTSVAIGGGGGNSENTERTKTETAFDAKQDKTITKTEKPRHDIKELLASVNVPRSYLAAIFKSIQNKEPTDLDLEKFAPPELSKIKDQVMRALAMTGEDDEKNRVRVDWFPDEMTLLPGGAAAQAGAGDSVINLVETYGSKAGLGALAAFSLLMMLMLVRRAAEGPVLPGEEPPSPQVIRVRSGRSKRGEETTIDMATGDEVVGEAAATDALLVGKEVDERTLHSQKVVDQVTEMVKEDPESAVGILRRWMEAEKS